jgi:hypothetical protein
MAKKKKKRKSGSEPTIVALKRPELLHIEKAATEPTLSSLCASDDQVEEVVETTHTEVKDVPSTEGKPEVTNSVPSQIESATNAAGEVFTTHELIVVTAPWGKQAIAQIEKFYPSPTGIWARYKPLLDELPAGWNWGGGVCRAELLVRAERHSEE